MKQTMKHWHLHGSKLIAAVGWKVKCFGSRAGSWLTNPKAAVYIAADQVSQFELNL